MTANGEMEKLGNIAAAIGTELQTATRPGTQLSRPTETRNQLRAFLKQMAAAFPHQEVVPETAEVWRLAFENLLREHGLKRLETALASFLTRTKFFPHPSEVREVLDEMAKKAKQVANAALPPIGCSACLDGDGDGMAGFVYTHRPGQPREVKPCECRLARARAKKALEAKA
jgi:hypothetical protein